MNNKSVTDYWERRYKHNGNSGAGSYGEECIFKSLFINKWIDNLEIASVSEIGCGDGNQCGSISVRRYYGYDISKTSIDICKKKYKNDKGKRFSLIDYDCYDDVVSSDMALSLDVLFHILEKDSFRHYMKELFSNKFKYVIIHTMKSDRKIRNVRAPHVKYNDISEWLSLVGFNVLDSEYYEKTNKEIYIIENRKLLEVTHEKKQEI